jgi:hypothetical protein
MVNEVVGFGTVIFPPKISRLHRVRIWEKPCHPSSLTNFMPCFGAPCGLQRELQPRLAPNRTAPPRSSCFRIRLTFQSYKHQVELQWKCLLRQIAKEKKRKEVRGNARPAIKEKHSFYKDISFSPCPASGKPGSPQRYFNDVIFADGPRQVQLMIYQVSMIQYLQLN